VRWHNLIWSPALLLSFVVSSDSRIQDSERLLTAADRFAMLYNWPEAAPLYAEAETLFTHSGDRKNALHARLGYLWAQADSGVTPEALLEVNGYLQDALVRSNPQLMLRALIAKAVLDRNTNELVARDSWEQILKLAERVGDRPWQDRAQAEIGQIVYMDGDVKGATARVRSALVSQYLHLDVGAAIYYTAMVGNGFVEAGRPETALEYCNTALRLAYVAKDRGFPYLAYQGKARALIALDRRKEANETLNAAIAEARRGHDFYALAQLLVVAGTATPTLDSVKRVDCLKEAVAISREKGFHHVFAWSTYELAQAYREAGDLDRSELLASNAVAAMRDIEDRYHLPQDLGLLAKLEMEKGNFNRADQLYSEATDVIDALLVNVNTKQLKGSLIATLSDVYVGHFELLATKLSNPISAYSVIEEARGRGLADALRGDRETLSASDEGTVDAEKEINQVQLALLHETNPQRRQTLLDNLFAAEQILAPVRKTNLPVGSDSDRSRPVPIGELQAVLHPDEAVLEYVLDEPQSFCLRITRSGVTVFTLPSGRKHIEEMVEQYLNAVRSRRSESGPSDELFATLIEPTLAGLKSQSRLIVVPDGRLHLLPFDALRDRNEGFVLESHIVTYAPSATVLALLREAPHVEQAKMNFLGVGGVVYSGAALLTATRSPVSDSGVETDFFGVDAVAFAPLPGSKQEVASVAGIVPEPSRLLVDTSATEGNFKSLPLADFRVIHLAVHGVASPQFPDRAALVLGSYKGSENDGLLQAREIRDLTIHADLVTLSACETGSGKLLGEEGIESLERAFLLAGAKSVIASLWTADDTFTIALMKHLYQHLVQGSDKGAALQQAKLDVLKEFGDQALPIYWAGFTLVGDGSTAVFK
jgi:CHAT domain-containing protein